jgi:hypothetical protein
LLRFFDNSLKNGRQGWNDAEGSGRKMKKMRALIVLLMATLTVFGAKSPWEKPVATWTADDIAALLNNSPWSVQTEAVVEDPYDAREEQPVTPPQTGLNIPGQNKQPWDGGVGKNRMGHMPTVPAMVRWESALPVRQAQKDAAAPEGNWYVISVAGLVPAGRYRSAGKTEMSSSSDGSVDARNPEELLEAFMSYSKIQQRGLPDLQPENVKLDAATGVVRIFFPRRTAIDPEQKEVLFSTHLGKLNVKAKFHISSMKYHGNIEL